ncbi:MAG: NAD(P)-dependent oxidoreductase [Betaproteobacteria bacterium]|nr:NAD(P)-dependent oxidoreductase [Betaproteobacteria bacterium]
MRIGFIGLGQMGRGMAGRLLDSGHELSVWNRSRAVAETFRPRGALVAERPDELLDADVVITMLADDAAVEVVWITSGMVRQVPASTIHLNMASVSLSMGQRLAEMHRAAGAPYVSAPVFGRPSAAATGQLDIVAAGAEAAIARCVPLFEALGRRWFNVGSEPHYANIVKIARNFLLGSIIESLGEAFALVQKSGVDPAAFLDIITSTSMNAPAYKNYGRLILENPAQATFSLKLGMKDVELALQAGDDTGVPLPLGELLRTQHLAAIARGYGDREWASLGNYIAECAGL